MNRRFETTRWTLVLNAREKGTPEAREALASLCKTYWLPIWFFIRRQGYGSEDAEDLTQGYFTRLLEKDYLDAVDPSAGRFRSFLLTSLKHFLSDERDKTKAQKRGGGVPLLSLDLAEADRLFEQDQGVDQNPERAFERQWARTVVERALSALRTEFETADKRKHFHKLKTYLAADTPRASYQETAESLAMSEGAVRVAVHRLRKRLGVLLRAEIAQTVNDPGEVDAELKFLLARM